MQFESPQKHLSVQVVLPFAFGSAIAVAVNIALVSSGRLFAASTVEGNARRERRERHHRPILIIVQILFTIIIIIIIIFFYLFLVLHFL
jgi:heme/copper-type cytochrome/quinol oxidase subunit 2